MVGDAAVTAAAPGRVDDGEEREKDKCEGDAAKEPLVEMGEESEDDIEDEREEDRHGDEEDLRPEASSVRGEFCFVCRIFRTLSRSCSYSLSFSSL